MVAFMSPRPAPTDSARPDSVPPDPGALLAWYDRHHRRLPWRVTPVDRESHGLLPDPYRVWLSEIMLQQTTVAAVKGYFEAFTQRWPTVEALAAADEADVMKAWAGLGYYSRARNLKACAETVVAQHGGRFPAEESALLDLPGIGAYTAAAITAIAFDRKATVVDGNVERVVTRLFAIEKPMPAAKPAVKRQAATLTPDRRPGDFAQAMMDLGATICTPKKPACALCPWERSCAARAAGTQELFPVKAPKAERPTRYGAAFVAIRADGAVLVRRRPPKGLLGGMTEVPSGAWTTAKSAADDVSAAPFEGPWRVLPTRVEHTFTHFHLIQTVRLLDLPLDRAAPTGMWWSPPAELGGEALPSVFRKVVSAALGRPV
jgi:A/G-specific adenine glycosylase